MAQTKNLHICIPDAVITEAEKMAAAEHITLDEFTHTAIKRYLDELGWKEFYAYGHQQARKIGIDEEDVERVIHEFRQEEREGKRSENGR